MNRVEISLITESASGKVGECDCDGYARVPVDKPDFWVVEKDFATLISKIRSKKQIQFPEMKGPDEESKVVEVNVLINNKVVAEVLLTPEIRLMDGIIVCVDISMAESEMDFLHDHKESVIYKLVRHQEELANQAQNGRGRDSDEELIEELSKIDISSYEPMF